MEIFKGENPSEDFTHENNMYLYSKLSWKNFPF